jgi:hypothetical protein
LRETLGNNRQKRPAEHQNFHFPAIQAKRSVVNKAFFLARASDSS